MDFVLMFVFVLKHVWLHYDIFVVNAVGSFNIPIPMNKELVVSYKQTRSVSLSLWKMRCFDLFERKNRTQNRKADE